MFHLEPHSDTSLRFYGEELCVLSRRDGTRRVASGDLASMLWYLNQAVGVDGVNKIGRGGDLDLPGLDMAAGVVRDLFHVLDTKKKIATKTDLAKQCFPFFQYAIANHYPLAALLDVSYRCNLACRHCYILHEILADSPAFLEDDVILRTIDGLASLGTLDVTISGGETTLNKRYREFVKRAKDLHMLTILKTNATTFTQKNASLYAEDPAHKTELSIYGADADTHDRFTAVPGSFERTLAGMRALKAAGIDCDVLCIVWRRNADQLGAIRDLVRGLGHNVAFSDVIYGRLDGNSSPMKLRITPRQRAGLVEAGFIDLFQPSPCIAGQTKVKVSARGEVSICELLPRGFGNVREHAIGEIWEDHTTRRYSSEIIGISTSERDDQNLPVHSCPGLNLLATGQLEGRTVI